MSAEINYLLEVRGLKKYYSVKAGFLKKTVAHVKAVDDISFKIKEGETLGLVGESGCGKSTTGDAILRLVEPTAGEIKFEGKDILSLNKKDLHKIRKKMQIIFQDPYTSLDPKMRIGDIVGESMIIHKLYSSKKEREGRIKKILSNVGISIDCINRYPCEFSGGQRQRIGIARALAIEPKFIVADEPVSALDVSVQAQVLNLLQDLQKEYHLTFLFISHDLNVVKYISDRIAVMYLGKIIEISEKNKLFNKPLHPYTKSLLSAILVPDPAKIKKRIILKGDVPSPLNPPSGCRFHPRCPEVMDICFTREPVTTKIDDEHYVACHLFSKAKKHEKVALNNI